MQTLLTWGVSNGSPPYFGSFPRPCGLKDLSNHKVNVTVGGQGSDQCRKHWLHTTGKASPSVLTRSASEMISATPRKVSRFRLLKEWHFKPDISLIQNHLQFIFEGWGYSFWGNYPPTSFYFQSRSSRLQLVKSSVWQRFWFPLLSPEATLTRNSLPQNRL